MDGIDSKYFKEKQAESKSFTSKDKPRSSPVDDSLELYTEESFDSPAQSPPRRRKSRTYSPSPPPTYKPTKITTMPQYKPAGTTEKSSKASVSKVTPPKEKSSAKVVPEKKTAEKPTVKKPEVNPPTTTKPVIKSTLTDSAKPYVVTKTTADKNPPKAVTVKKPITAPQTEPRVIKKVVLSKPPQELEKKHVVITADGKTIVTKQVATVKPSVAARPAVTAAKTADSSTAAKPLAATDGAATKTVKPKTKIIIRKVSSSEEATASAGGVLPAAAKPKFKPISAPSSAEPVVKSTPIVYTTTVYSKPTIPQVASNLEICKYFPHCARGNACFFYHPKPGSQIPGVRAPVSKFKWKAT